MSPNRRLRLAPVVESLEGRRVLSHAAGLGALVNTKAINLVDGSGAGAILSALNGGPGSEFVSLIRKQVPNVTSVLRQFQSGRRSELDIRGFAIKHPHLAPGYTGPQLDQFNPTAAGALLLNDGRLELGAIMRGPIDLPIATTYVWGISRGGPNAGAAGFGPAGISYDAVVSVTRAGTAIDASVTDLKTGQTTAIDPSAVKVEGPTIRVFLTNPSGLLPSTGAPLTKYRFAFWTRSGPDGISDLAGYVPSAGTLPIGTLNARK